MLKSTMQKNKGHKGLLKFVTLMGIGVSLLGVGGVTANASSKAYYGHFDSRRITYHIDSTSKHYRGIWKSAIKEWNNNQNVIKLRKAKNKKSANLRLTSRAHLKNDLVWLVNNNTAGGIFDTSYVKLSRSYFPQGQAYDKYRVMGAEQVIGSGVGLNQTNDDSVMGTLSNKFTPLVISNLKAAYKGIK